jgi:tetratricopeptide (TPR) repeat protein
LSRERFCHSQAVVFSLIRIFVLFFFILFVLNFSYAHGSDIRTINLKIAADEEFRYQSDWQIKARRLISNSSQKFEENFGIRFRIEKFVFWSSDNRSGSMFELLHDLRKKISHNSCDVVMGLTSQFQNSGAIEFSGVATYLNNYVLVRQLPSESAMELIITHEFSHLFGAADLHEQESIMDEEKPGRKFDDFTKRLIVLNKQRDFNPYGFPLSKDKQAEVVDLYEKRKALGLKEESVSMLLAVFYLEMENYPSMMEVCLNLVRQSPDSAEAHNFLGIVLRRTGRVDEAIAEYKKAISLQTRFPQPHYNLGIAYMKKELFNEAVNEYEKALKLYPRYAKAYSNLGYVYVEINQADKAELACRKALKINPCSAEALSTLGAALILKGEYKEAEAVSKKALEINPELYGPHNNLGSVYANLHRLSEAVMEYKTALKIKDDYPEAHYNLGRVYYMKGMYREAENEFLEAIRLRSQYDKAFCSLAAVHITFGLIERAVQECRFALEINPRNSVAHFNLANALYRKGFLKQAEKECQQSIQLGLDTPQSYSFLGIILEETEKRGEAEKQFLKALQLNPQFLEARLNLAGLYFKMKNFMKSELHYKKVLEIDPKNGQAYHYLALVYFYLKDFESSMNYMTRAENLGVKVNPDFKKDLLKKLEKDRCRTQSLL